MSVRWKPLIVLSGLFVAVALCGLIAFVLASGQNDAGAILEQARAARQAGKFEEAEIYYLQASQIDARRGEISQELADFYGDWIEKSEPSKHLHLQGLRLRYLLETTKFDKTAVEPRRALLAESLEGDNPAEQAHWAREVVALDADDADALFVLAIEALDATPANMTEAVRVLESLKRVAPDRDRTAWIEARIAQSTQDREGLDRLLTGALEQESIADGSVIDQLCRLRLLVLLLERSESEEVPDRALGRIRTQAEFILGREGIQGNRIVELHRLSRRAKEALGRIDGESADARWEPLAETIDRGFRDALDGDEPAGLWVHQAYADHLNLRGDRTRCLEVIQAALTPEVLKDATLQDDVMRMRETAIKAALADSADPDRFEKVAPHIEGLISGPRPEYQGLGHLFQGAIALERSGLAGPDPRPADGPKEAAPIIEARTHLREATVKLPNVVLAKALYGIALMMSGETSLGRQHLLEAQRAEDARPGSLEPRYQVWAAWSLLEAQYPEEAERIVDRLLERKDEDPGLANLSGTIRLLQGEIARSRKTDEDLEVARAAYTAAIVEGESVPPAVALRLAELTIALDGPEAGLAQLEDLRQHGGGTPAIEALAVSTLIDLQRMDEATATLKAARQEYPGDGQLAVLESAIHLKEDRAEQADEVLASYLTQYPDEIAVAQTRARILAGPLQRADQARSVLSEAAERAGITAPYVQLAMLDVLQGDYDAAAGTVATIRSRWPEAAASDLLDAQICLARRDLTGASKFLEKALQKDPSNKVAQFWKAQLDSRSGSPARASETFQAILRDRPVKELGDGLSLSTAAEWSLASLSMENKDFDDAIARLQTIVQGESTGSMERAARWRIISARSQNGQWAEAKAELISLLNEPESTIEERVQAADYFRQNGELEVAGKLVDQVLDREPGNAGAVVLKSYLLSEEGDTTRAVEILRSAISAEEQPPAVYLMLAAFAADLDPSDEATASIRSTLEEGLKVHPDSTDLLRTLYESIRRSAGVDEALKYVEAKAEADAEGDRFQRLLVDLYTKEGRLDEAETLLSTLIEAQPSNAQLAAGMVTIVSSKAIRASRKNLRDEELELNARTLSLVQGFREQFPDDLRFPQAECELAMRQGDYAKAEAVARQLEQINPESPIGPLLRAQAYRDQGLAERAVQAYREALEQNPHRDDIRLTIGQVLLESGRADEAMVEAGRVLDRSPEQPDALLLRASALVARPGTPEQVAERQEEAIALLKRAIDTNPGYSKAYLEIARIDHLRGNTAEAIAALKAARETRPDDFELLSALIRYLVAVPSDGSASGEGNVAEAELLAEQVGEEDANGAVSLALALGFHRGDRPDLAKPWAEKAAGLIEEPIVFSTYGDILLSFAESQDDPAGARSLFEEAVSMYDKVLASDSRSIEAINNKAWILHRYLGKDQEALELVEGLLGRVERRTLPGEYFDTLGAIQQSVGRNKDAEQSYAEGLKKSPDLAVLNFHMGRLIAMDQERSARASQYLAKAWDSRDQLSTEDATELQEILDRVGN